MKPAPKQQRAIRKRNAVLAAAFEEFSAHGFEPTTAKSIADRAGVATGTFYQYFDNKQDVLLEITRQRFEELQDHLQVPQARLEITPAGPADDGTANIRELFREALGFLYDFHQQEAGLHDVLEYRRRVDPALAALMDEPTDPDGPDGPDSDDPGYPGDPDVPKDPDDHADPDDPDDPDDPVDPG